MLVCMQRIANDDLQNPQSFLQTFYLYHEDGVLYFFFNGQLEDFPSTEEAGKQEGDLKEKKKRLLMKNVA